MNMIAFDTLRFVKRLQAAGYTPEQAEAQAEAYAEAGSESLATKLDIEITKTQLQHTIEASAANLRAEFREGNLNLIKWIVPMMIGQTAVVAALVKLF